MSPGQLMDPIDALAAYVLAHPWRTAWWLVIVSVGWKIGKLFGADLYRLMMKLRRGTRKAGG